MKRFMALSFVCLLLAVGCQKPAAEKSPEGDSQQIAQKDPASQLSEEELFERRFPSRRNGDERFGGMGGMGGGMAGMGGGGGFGGGIEQTLEAAGADDLILGNTASVDAEAPQRISDQASFGGGLGGRPAGDGGDHPIANSALGKSAPGTTETWKRSRIVPHTTRLMVGDKEELPLQGMQVDVRIDGFRARVLLDCYYFNDGDMPLEGIFQLRLPNGASPYYLAFGQTRYTSQDLPPQQPQFFTSSELEQSGTSPEEILDLRRDSWREPQSARVVPKQKAVESYSDVVREQIDPALMEWSGAGIFRTSVYPLEAGKLHRIVIGYDVDLLPVGDDLVYELNLPESLEEIVVDLKVAVPDGTKVTVTPETVAEAKNGRYRFEGAKVETITARISKPGSLLLQGQSHQVGPLFTTRLRPLPTTSDGIDGATQALFMVDVSLSSNPDQFNVWLNLMKQILEQNRGELKEFGVIFFNVESFWWQESYLANTPENVAQLIAFANNLALEGASDLGNVFRHVARSEWTQARGTPDLFLLSDAAVTWGENDIYALSAILDRETLGPLFAYRTGMFGTDTRVLNHLARETGGAVFTVVGEAELEVAARAHRQRPMEIVSVEIPGCQDLLLAGRPNTLFPGQELQLVGRGEPKMPVEVVLTVKSGKRVSKLKVPINAVLESALASRSYGQVAVGQLEDLQAATETVALAYARKFRVAEQTCSLLMLESEEDYERFNIKTQEDAAVVKNTLASITVANALDQLASSLGDPQAQFFQWLQWYQDNPEEGFTISEAFESALKRMPKESFVVSVKPLVCKQRRRDDIPKKILEQLSAKELDYDEISAEAVRRSEGAGAADGLRVLSSLVENRPGDTTLARDVAYSVMEWGLREQAYFLFRRVLVARPHEALTYHLIARCLAEMGQTDLALAYYEIAMSGTWDDRFGDFSAIVAWDYLRLLRDLENGKATCSVPEFAAARLVEVAAEYDVDHKCDLIAVVSWNTDRTDVDFHIVDPNGEECYYENPETKLGGLLSADVTAGFGPEMFVLQEAKPGLYYMAVEYFSEDISRASTRTKVYVTIYQNWGRPEETMVRKVISLNSDKDFRKIAVVEVPEK